MKTAKLYELKISLISQRTPCVLNFTMRPTAEDVTGVLKALQLEAASVGDPDPDDDYGADTAAAKILELHAFSEVAERMQPLDSDTGDQFIKVAGTSIGRIQHRTLDAWER